MRCPILSNMGSPTGSLSSAPIPPSSLDCHFISLGILMRPSTFLPNDAQENQDRHFVTLWLPMSRKPSLLKPRSLSVSLSVSLCSEHPGS
mmetsp:Transcript_38274/g.81103  ORF Transcript_38274/g.81103 Transcript_38274/m.81103 type:complete len:90 (+) Transcript_38274:398-667(+)